MVPSRNKFTEWAVDVDEAAAAVDVTKAKWEKMSIYRVLEFHQVCECDSVYAACGVVWAVLPRLGGSGTARGAQAPCTLPFPSQVSQAVGALCR